MPIFNHKQEHIAKPSTAQLILVDNNLALSVNFRNFREILGSVPKLFQLKR